MREIILEVILRRDDTRRYIDERDDTRGYIEERIYL
jgi:hypothetical protein